LRLARWDGHAWHDEPAPPRVPPAGPVNLVVNGPNDVWTCAPATGRTVEHFDGTTWRSVPLPADLVGPDAEVLQVVADSAGGVWVSTHSPVTADPRAEHGRTGGLLHRTATCGRPGSAMSRQPPTPRWRPRLGYDPERLLLYRCVYLLLAGNAHDEDPYGCDSGVPLTGSLFASAPVRALLSSPRHKGGRSPMTHPARLNSSTHPRAVPTFRKQPRRGLPRSNDHPVVGKNHE
jgi:hypothetical protein